MLNATSWRVLVTIIDIEKQECFPFVYSFPTSALITLMLKEYDVTLLKLIKNLKIM